MQAVMENKESTLPGLMKIKAGNEESAMNDLTELSSIIILQANFAILWRKPSHRGVPV